MALQKLASDCQHPRLLATLVLSILLNILILCLAFYGYLTIVEMKNDIYNLQHQRQTEALHTHRVVKREVLSGRQDQTDLKSLLSGALTGAQGPPGVQGPRGAEGPRGVQGPIGPQGRDGTNGKDFASLRLLREVVNETVVKEWTQLSGRLPNYGGATYTRWGRKSCPTSSKLIYNGQMASPDRQAAGGGANYLCLPSDPQYSNKAPAKAYHSLLSTVWYQTYKYPDIFPGYVSTSPASCSICEADQRLTKLMIPAAVTCPDSSWILEYSGYIMSAATNYDDQNVIKDHHFKTSYVCIDQQAESFSKGVTGGYFGSVLHFTGAKCSGDGALKDCPPLQDRKVLSCVVCTK